MTIKNKGPADFAEQYLIESIWNGTIPVNSALPAERVLADKVGVTRTTLREVLQRLSKEGWVSIHHGKQTRVNDFWETAGLNILTTITRLDITNRANLIDQLLCVRTNIATSIIRMAVHNHRRGVIEFLKNSPSIDASSKDFTEFDYRFYHHVAVSSNNMIYVLILNGLQELYRKVGAIYFANEDARILTARFYKKLQETFEKEEIHAIMEIVRDWAFDNGKIWIRLRQQIPEDFLD